MKKLISLFLFFIIVPSISIAQDDIQIGNPYAVNNSQRTGGFYDYSDPAGVNIKVQLWGYVKYPGYYVIPARSNINDLLSLGGGPTEDANINDVRIFKSTADSSGVMTKYNFNDLMWEDSLTTKINFVRLQAGDMVIVPGEPRYFVRQDIAFYLSVVTALASITALILSIIK